jgi:transcriptional regulator NrdR family protein
MANQGGGCPACGCRHDKVAKTTEKVIKWRGEVLRIKRYRQCRNCGLSYSSVELPEEDVTKLIQDSNDLADLRAGKITLEDF